MNWLKRRWEKARAESEKRYEAYMYRIIFVLKGISREWTTTRTFKFPKPMTEREFERERPSLRPSLIMGIMKDLKKGRREDFLGRNLEIPGFRKKDLLFYQVETDSFRLLEKESDWRKK